MDAAAIAVLVAFPDVRLAFGESDEYSFVLPPSTKLYGMCWLERCHNMADFVHRSNCKEWRRSIAPHLPPQSCA